MQGSFTLITITLQLCCSTDLALLCILPSAVLWNEGWTDWWRLVSDTKGDPDSEPVPGWWPQSNAWLSAECTLKDVKCFFSLSLFLLFWFNLTISLSLPPDCIRIDCSLSKWFYPFLWLKCVFHVAFWMWPFSDISSLIHHIFQFPLQPLLSFFGSKF